MVPEAVKDQPELVLENNEQDEVTKTDAVEEPEIVPEIIIEPEAVPEIIIELETVPNIVNDPEIVPETEQQAIIESELFPKEVTEEPEIVTEDNVIESEIVPEEISEIVVEEAASIEDSVTTGIDADLVTENAETVPETAESVEEDQGAAEVFEEEVETKVILMILGGVKTRSLFMQST